MQKMLQNAKRDISVFLKWGCMRCSQAVTLEGEAEEGETSQCISMEALARDLQKGSVHFLCKCAKKTKTNNVSLTVYIKSYSALLLLFGKRLICALEAEERVALSLHCRIVPNTENTAKHLW